MRRKPASTRTPAYDSAMITLLSVLIWLYLLLAHGGFWRSTPELAPAVPVQFPEVDIIVPARDEAATIGPVIHSLLAQDYGGRFIVTLVDDNSTDDTSRLAGTSAHLRILAGQVKPAGWSGKLWALHQAVAATGAPLVLFTDADIVHDPRHLSSLVARLEMPRVDLVSEMVRLNCRSVAERMLVPAFVYFFQLLYPFSRVNDPKSPVAAAAGGTVLIRREALERSGGLEAIKGALIDDVALACRIKAGGALYLGHSGLAASIREYPTFASIWQMIARTAFTQLRYSAWLLAGTVAGLAWVFLLPLVEMLFAEGWRRAAGAAAFLIAAFTYTPTHARYRRSLLWAPVLPLVAMFYLAATLGSAVDHWRGAGVKWKSRAYDGVGPGVKPGVK
jgi:hopene-associated glycosyltransferase HpnB